MMYLRYEKSLDLKNVLKKYFLIYHDICVKYLLIINFY